MNDASPGTGEEIEAVIDRYADMVYRIAFHRVLVKADADDVFQEVFLTYLRKKPRFENEDHRRYWFVNVTLKCCRKASFSPWRRHTAPLEEFPELAASLDDTGLTVYAAVQRLPAKYRTPICLYYYEGFSVKEIAAATGAKESTVRSQMNRGRNKLRDILKGEFFYEP